MSTAPRWVYNSRLKDIAPGVVSENIADLMTLTYSATTTQAAVNFGSRDYLYVNGSPKPMAGISPTTLGVQVDNTILPRIFGNGLYDPVTGLDLGQLSAAGFMLYLKNTFDILKNEYDALHNPPDPDMPYPSAQAIAQANGLFDLYGTPHGLSAPKGDTSNAPTAEQIAALTNNTPTVITNAPSSDA